MSHTDRIPVTIAPTVVEFRTPRCPACAAMEPHLQAVADRHAARVDFIQIDASSDTQVAADLGVKGTPTLVGFRDGALMAHVGPPDMRHAIGYALNWPERRHLPVERLDLVKTGQLTFREPDEARHPALRLAREVMKTGGYSGAVFNAAKEAALDGFIAGQIGFLDMAGVVETVLERFAARTDCGTSMTLETVHAIDGEARRVASEVIATF